MHGRMSSAPISLHSLADDNDDETENGVNGVEKRNRFRFVCVHFLNFLRVSFFSLVFVPFVSMCTIRKTFSSINRIVSDVLREIAKVCLSNITGFQNRKAFTQTRSTFFFRVFFALHFFLFLLLFLDSIFIFYIFFAVD